MATPKTIQYESYIITREESGKIVITNNGEACTNAKAAVREIAQKCGFEVDSKWTTRQAGAKLIAYLSKEGEPEKSATVGSDETQYDGDKTTKLKAHLSNNATSTQRQEIEKLLGSMVYVEGGTFLMGAQSTAPNAPNYDSEAFVGESPVHRVTVSSFYMSKYEVTQGLWEAVMGTNPSKFKGDNLPVDSVSWYDCQDFIAKLNKLTGKEFRLPTEAEWEYAARGGNKSRGYKYSGSNTIGVVAWYIGNYSDKTHPVGSKQPNELGLYDMSGNVWEWCQDRYRPYSFSSQTDPTGPSSGSYRVHRGGCWFSSAQGCRVSNRFGSAPGDRGDADHGFRLVCR